MANQVAVVQQPGLPGMYASPLQQKLWSKMIFKERLIADPFLNIQYFSGDQIDQSNFEGPVDLKSQGKAIIRVENMKGKGAAEEVILKKHMALKTDFVQGTTNSQEGVEEPLVIKYAKLYANEYFKSVPKTVWGKLYEEQDWTGMFETTKPLLAQALGEYEGYLMRTALISGVSDNLTEDPYTGTFTNLLNHNIYTPGTDLGWVTYNSTFATYIGAVNTNVTDIEFRNLNFSDLNTIPDSAHAPERKIMSLNIDKGKKYFLFVHPDEFSNLTDKDQTGSYGELVASGAIAWKGSEIQDMFPGSKFRPNDRLVVIRDGRVPVVDIQAATYDAYYKKLGETDDRIYTGGVGKLCYANMLIGEEALGLYEPSPSDYKYEEQHYKKYGGVAIAGVKSYQTIRWELDAGASEDPQQGGSALVLTPIIT
jgi:hypothetical protein